MANSYNGWLASKNPADFGGLSKLVVAGESFAPGVRSGDVHTVLQYVAEQLHRRVEPVFKQGWHEADDWGYHFKANANNPNQLSCHASGTAFDYNATRHPNGKKNTFTAIQFVEIDRILAEVDNAVTQLRGYDEMHFEIRGNAAKIGAVARKLRGGSQSPEPRPSGARLQQGDRGPEVRILQILLTTMHKAIVGTWNVTDYFGPVTKEAVIKFQRHHGLVADGIVGPATRAKLGM
jgi:murein L,D-transpeptidase YcbB/YkuD